MRAELQFTLTVMANLPVANGGVCFTRHVHQAMSALPPKADLCSAMAANSGHPGAI